MYVVRMKRTAPPKVLPQLTRSRLSQQVSELHNMSVRDTPEWMWNAYKRHNYSKVCLLSKRVHRLCSV